VTLKFRNHNLRFETRKLKGIKSTKVKISIITLYYKTTEPIIGYPIVSRHLKWNIKELLAVLLRNKSLIVSMNISRKFVKWARTKIEKIYNLMTKL